MSNQQGLFVLSVDVRSEQPRITRDLVTRLLNTMQHTRVSATWCLPEPGASAIVELISRRSPGHELALLADSSWAGQDSGRTVFARELTRRVETAAAKGHALRSLALLDTELTTNLDLLVKHRISLVRSPASSQFQPRSLRFGVWQVPVSFRFPARPRWTLGCSEWTVGRALTKAAKGGDLVHVVADVNGMTSHVELATVERILSVVSRRQQKGLLRSVTLKGLSQILAPRRKTRVSRSVLRAA